MADPSVIHPPEPHLTLQNLVPFKKKATRGARHRQDRVTLTQAFELGDSDDRERVVRAAALLLDWSTQQDMGENKLITVAQGVSEVLYGIARDLAQEKVRLGRGESE